VGGTPVQNGEIIVSVDERNGNVFKVYNNFYPGQPVSNLAPAISSERALDIAWNDLKVHGSMTFLPLVDLQYQVNAKGHFDLVYITTLSVEAPFGVWEHVIDARTGKIIGVRDTRITRKPAAAVDYKRYVGPIWERAATTSKFLEGEAAKVSEQTQGTFVNGSGLVFDPDPRTTLNRADLADTSPAAEFDAAYFQRTLSDLTFANNTYELKGPWVSILDFEMPSTNPSTTTNGIWTAKRGSNAFNDAMTYYHIDANQRYMQSLGFKGNKAIQGASIGVDSDGLSGQDNSHFIPSSNRLAFGHGCVDDNEDSDVILHEYGHAINFSINKNWTGGDTGGMGEGFGDYWAGSYSVSTQNGTVFKPDYVFSWDGEPCWAGRRLNATALQYDHSKIYGAHSGVPGGVSDELWSTPLFQSLLAATAAGIPRAEIDTVILEAQFGLGAALKMRDMANSIVQTAAKLYPNGNHAGIFLDKFAAQKILDIPQAVLSYSSSTVTDGSNNTADPGETIDLNVVVKNQGTLPASKISARLRSESDLVVVNQGDSTYDGIALGASSGNKTAFNVTVDPSFACGDEIPLQLDIDYADSGVKTTTIDVRVPTGTPADQVIQTATPGIEIPDNNVQGIETTIVVESTSKSFTPSALILL
jgi:uncharacterized repeat protein (TIGR01451 family)